jgi:hypothetical protein
MGVGTGVGVGVSQPPPVPPSQPAAANTSMAASIHKVSNQDIFFPLSLAIIFSSRCDRLLILFIIDYLYGMIAHSGRVSAISLYRAACLRRGSSLHRKGDLEPQPRKAAQPAVSPNNQLV